MADISFPTVATKPQPNFYKDYDRGTVIVNTDEAGRRVYHAPFTSYLIREEIVLPRITEEEKNSVIEFWNDHQQSWADYNHYEFGVIEARIISQPVEKWVDSDLDYWDVSFTIEYSSVNIDNAIAKENNEENPGVLEVDVINEVDSVAYDFDGTVAELDITGADGYSVSVIVGNDLVRVNGTGNVLMIKDNSELNEVTYSATIRVTNTNDPSNVVTVNISFTVEANPGKLTYSFDGFISSVGADYTGKVGTITYAGVGSATATITDGSSNFSVNDDLEVILNTENNTESSVDKSFTVRIENDADTNDFFTFSRTVTQSGQNVPIAISATNLTATVASDYTGKVADLVVTGSSDYTYSITSGGDDFSISGNDLEIDTVNTTDSDVTKSVTIQVSDDNFENDTATITVSVVQQAQGQIALTVTITNQNVAYNYVGKVADLEVTGASNYTLSITSGSNNFSINAGEELLLNTTNTDFSGSVQKVVVVQAVDDTDATNVSTQTITITQDAAPEDVMISFGTEPDSSYDYNFSGSAGTYTTSGAASISVSVTSGATYFSVNNGTITKNVVDKFYGTQSVTLTLTATNTDDSTDTASISKTITINGQSQSAGQFYPTHAAGTLVTLQGREQVDALGDQDSGFTRGDSDYTVKAVPASEDFPDVSIQTNGDFGLNGTTDSFTTFSTYWEQGYGWSTSLGGSSNSNLWGALDVDNFDDISNNNLGFGYSPSIIFFDNYPALNSDNEIVFPNTEDDNGGRFFLDNHGAASNPIHNVGQNSDFQFDIIPDNTWGNNEIDVDLRLLAYDNSTEFCKLELRGRKITIRGNDFDNVGTNIERTFNIASSSSTAGRRIFITIASYDGGFVDEFDVDSLRKVRVIVDVTLRDLDGDKVNKLNETNSGAEFTFTTDSLFDRELRIDYLDWSLGSDDTYGGKIKNIGWSIAESNSVGSNNVANGGVTATVTPDKIASFDLDLSGRTFNTLLMGFSGASFGLDDNEGNAIIQNTATTERKYLFAYNPDASDEFKGFYQIGENTPVEITQPSNVAKLLSHKLRFEGLVKNRANNLQYVKDIVVIDDNRDPADIDVSSLLEDSTNFYGIIEEHE